MLNLIRYYAFFMHIILSIKYFIPFVIIKNNTIFVYPIRTAVATAQYLAVFLCLIFCKDTCDKTRCRDYRNCLNTIALYGLDNGNLRHRVLSYINKISNSTKMKTQIEMPSLKDDAQLPEALQSALSDYFQFNGTPADIETNLWTMLETATAGCEEIGLSAKDVLEFMMLYKTTKALVSVLHSYHTKTTVELCNN